jgi:hypothetical protein
VGINDQSLHSFEWQITRTSDTYSGGVSWSLTYDGNPLITNATNTGGPGQNIFDTIYFAQGNVTTDFRVDNIELLELTQTYGIPEPSSIALLLGGFGLLWHTARRRSKA